MKVKLEIDFSPSSNLFFIFYFQPIIFILDVQPLGRIDVEDRVEVEGQFDMDATSVF
jgi:hypothetical protein